MCHEIPGAGTDGPPLLPSVFAPVFAGPPNRESESRTRSTRQRIEQLKQIAPLSEVIGRYVKRCHTGSTCMPEYDRKITPRRVGGLIRRRLGLVTHKSHGVFVVSRTELPKLPRLYQRYGVDLGRAVNTVIDQTSSRNIRGADCFPVRR